ncbi:universal stress protein [Oleisolibacter albus]|uniref:universal stress protein n=1 Tax=Oleisolibacter albus TaxID=2171757 RepID=UPI0013905995|nr:universal stress protein [Oleisolibacter albus]
MAYRDILVHLKPGHPGDAHLHAAVSLAALHGARLTALMTFRDLAVLKLLYSESSPIVQERAAEVERQVADVRRQVEDLARQQDVRLRFEMAEGDPAELVEVAGRFHDLIVVEQSPPEREETGPDVCEHAAMVSGRPVLVVPPQGNFSRIGRHVLVGWNASREAALALQHARPFLDGAERITVLSGPAREQRPTITRLPPVDIQDHLRHFCPEVALIPSAAVDAQAGAGILAAAAHAGADLVVMGAYGRSRLREWLMGGATHHVLRHARLPVLVAH